ncbi:unnamed protein product, partial [Brassica oleracea var. botrytis]
MCIYIYYPLACTSSCPCERHDQFSLQQTRYKSLSQLLSITKPLHLSLSL